MKLKIVATTPSVLKNTVSQNRKIKYSRAILKTNLVHTWSVKSWILRMWPWILRINLKQELYCAIVTKMFFAFWEIGSTQAAPYLAISRAEAHSFPNVWEWVTGPCCCAQCTFFYEFRSNVSETIVFRVYVLGHKYVLDRTQSYLGEG